MSRFRYSGPVMGLTLTAGGEVIAEEILVPGRVYTLPPDHPRVVALVTARRLMPSDTPAPAAVAPPPDPTTPPAAVAARRRRTKEL